MPQAECAAYDCAQVCAHDLVLRDRALVGRLLPLRQAGPLEDKVPGKENSIFVVGKPAIFDCFWRVIYKKLR